MLNKMRTSASISGIVPMDALLITRNNFSFMQVNQGYGTNSSPCPAGQKEGIRRTWGQFLSTLKNEFFLDSLIKVNYFYFFN